MKKKTENKKGGGDISVISLAWDLGWIIAVPIVVFATGGALLDKVLQSSPWFLLAGIGFSLLITSGLVYKKTVEAIGILSEVDDSDDKKEGENGSIRKNEEN